MAAVLSPQSSSASNSPVPRSSPSANNAQLPALPPLITSPPARPSPSRVPSYAKNRLSTFSTASGPSSRSRPQSTVFPVFHSSLTYTLVRDFAYPVTHPLFYGPLPDQHSELSTPVSESHRRLSDPPPTWAGSRGEWNPMPWQTTGEQLPQTSFADGPPWSEDEDLHSPVVTSAKHKKHKSHATIEFDHNRGRSSNYYTLNEPRRGSYTGTNGDGSQTYYISEDTELANGPGGEYITYPPDQQQQQSSLAVPRERSSRRRDSHFATTLPNRHYLDSPTDDTQSPSPSGSDHYDDSDFIVDPTGESRYSRDYQFTIASPDEEMHGKAVALFDFTRENENELPLVEGQIILVSYRHGQGWLVAQDPKTGESGLVPEEYIRLLRDIEGGWSGLMEGVSVATQMDHNMNQQQDVQIVEPAAASTGSNDALTPTQASHERKISSNSQVSTHSGNGNDYYPPVVSSFSTSSKDLKGYPKDLLSGTPVESPHVRGHSEDLSRFQGRYEGGKSPEKKEEAR